VAYAPYCPYNKKYNYSCTTHPNPPILTRPAFFIPNAVPSRGIRLFAVDINPPVERLHDLRVHGQGDRAFFHEPNSSDRIYRLQNWEFKPGGVKGPRYVGKLVSRTSGDGRPESRIRN